jgi:hypothetical protein
MLGCTPVAVLLRRGSTTNHHGCVAPALNGRHVLDVHATLHASAAFCVGAQYNLAAVKRVAQANER